LAECDKSPTGTIPPCYFVVNLQFAPQEIGLNFAVGSAILYLLINTPH
jgi:hypothetical protein